MRTHARSSPSILFRPPPCLRNLELPQCLHRMSTDDRIVEETDEYLARFRLLRATQAQRDHLAGLAEGFVARECHERIEARVVPQDLKRVADRPPQEFFALITSRRGPERFDERIESLISSPRHGQRPNDLLLLEGVPTPIEPTQEHRHGRPVPRPRGLRSATDATG